MLQDTNVERYVENAIKPLKKEIAKLKVQIEELNKALRIHDFSGELNCDHPDEAIIKDKPTDYCLACNRNI